MSDVRFAWPGRNAFTLAVDGFVLPARERLLLIGPSGSGKSTFLGLLCGILAPQSGRIEILGTRHHEPVGASARDGFRAEHFGIIFQMFNLLPYGTVIDNVLLPLELRARAAPRATAKGEAEEEAARLLDRLGLEADLVRGPIGGQPERRPAAAGGGRPGADRRAGADRGRRADLGAGSQTARRPSSTCCSAKASEAGATLIMVSHDESLAARFDRVMRLDEIARAGQKEQPA